MKELITRDNCLDLTGFVYTDLLALTGIFGIHSLKQLLIYQMAENIKFLAEIEDDVKVSVLIETPEIIALHVDINIRTMEIDIILFRLENKNMGLGFQRLVNQVEAAQKHKFTHIALLAYGNIDLHRLEDWDGYFVWGKYGFVMYHEDDIQYFGNQMVEDRLMHCTTINILLSTKEGTALWKYVGQSWYGKFELATTSDSYLIYNEYQKKKSTAL